MLLEFSVTNFRSIKEKQTLSFLPVKGVNEYPDNVLKKGESEALKSIALFGRNAAGKSNVIEALSATRRLLTSSAYLSPMEPIGGYDPYLLADKEKYPTEIELWFIVGSHSEYKYTFSFNRENIITESLIRLDDGEAIELFTRTAKNVSWGMHLNQELVALVERATLPNQLLITKCATNNVMEVIIPYTYIGNEIQIEYLLSNDFDDFDNIARDLYKEPESPFTKFMNELVGIADTGIAKLIGVRHLENGALEIESNSNPFILFDYHDYTLKTIHTKDPNSNAKSVKNVEFDIYNESIGTRRILNLGYHIWYVLQSGSVLVIDELNRSLHPDLERLIIKVFHDPELNRNGAQLLFTTHDTSLMERNMFRRDQIWFAEKEYGATSLYSVADFTEVKRRTNIKEWYENGRFGGKPAIGTLNPDMFPPTNEQQ